MKKAMVWLSILVLVCMMAVTPQIATAEDDVKLVKSKYLDGMGLDSDAWCALDVTRNYFVLCMIMDCLDTWTDDELTISAEALHYNTIYLVEDEDNVAAFIFGENDLMIFSYETESKIAMYTLCDIGDAHEKADEYMKALEKQGSIPKYYKIDSDDIMELMETQT